MNILDDKSKLTFHEDLRNIIYKFKFDKIIPKLVGSSSIKALRYYGDYDLITNITKKYDAKYIYERIKDIIHNLLLNDDIFFMELKIQSNKGKKYRWFYKSEFNYDDFLNKIIDVSFIKIDIIARIEYRFIEISSIYNFNNNNDDNAMDSLYKDIKELKREGKHFKILKRIYSIYRKDKNINGLRLLTDYFNSKIGEEYQTISNIEAIDKLIKNYKDKLTKKKVEINLQLLGISPKLNLKNIINTGMRHINNDALKFINQHNIKYNTL